MKEVNIKFYGVGYNRAYQASVVIYDDSNRKVFNGVTYNGEIKVCLRKEPVYRLVSSFMNDCIDTNIYIGNNCCYCFRFRNSIIVENNDSNQVTFFLTDYYYDNLPIERGEIILWPK